MPPLAAGMLAFFLVWLVFGFMGNNLEATFIPGVITGVVAYFGMSKYFRGAHWKLDHPPVEPYRIRLPSAYGQVKEILKTCYDPPHEWRIRHENKDSKGRSEIRAYFEIRDDSWREQRWLAPSGVITKGITLDLALTPQEDGSTDLELTWTVNCPFPASRADCDAVIQHTSDEIHTALQDLEVQKHG